MLDEPTGPEQRAFPRVDVALPVQFEFEGETFQLRSLNISAGGMFLETTSPPPREALLTFQIRLGDKEDDELLILRGTVVHLGAGEGIGVRFDRVDDFEEELTRLEAFLAIHDE